MSELKRKLLSVAALFCLGAAFGFVQVAAAAAQRKTNKRAENPTPVVAAPPAKIKKATQPSAPPTVDVPAKAVDTSATAAVQFTYQFTQPQFNPHLVRIEHDAAGRGKISFERRDDTAPLVEPLEIAPAALVRIKAAWDALAFLDSTENYQAEKQFPHLGTMRLRMTRGTQERAAEFNWTHNPDAEALVKEYRRLGDQQLLVFEITLARQYQPSESVKLVKRLEYLFTHDGLSDASQLLPFLRELSTDERLPLIARNRVEKIVKQIEK